MNAEQLNYATKGNAAASEFLRVFISHCHTLDDVIDRDKPVTDENLIASEIEWLLALSGNQFFQQHRALLVPLIVQACNAYLDSNKWAMDEKPEKRITSDALKGWYHEVVFHTAFICGGWAHLRDVTSKHREYDFEKENLIGIQSDSLGLGLPEHTCHYANDIGDCPACKANRPPTGHWGDSNPRFGSVCKGAV